MCELGNSVINRIYEARIDEITIKKPQPSSPRYEPAGHMSMYDVICDTNWTEHIIVNGKNVPYLQYYSFIM